MIFTAYFDESGTHRDSPVVSVGGYIATSEAWEHFEIEWLAALNRFGIDCFHMTDFANGTKQFAGWPEETRRACLGLLVEIINRNVLGSVGSCIPHALYQEIFSPEADRFIGGAYGLAATSCLMQLGAKLHLIGVHGSIEYVFEDGATGAGQILHTFQMNEQNPMQKERLCLESIRFEHKRDFVPLQAADILAYELYRQLPKDMGIDHRNRRWGLLRLANAPTDWCQLERQQIELFAEASSLAARLTESELAPKTAAQQPRRPAVAISRTEFQERWKWWHQFAGNTVRRRLPEV